MKPADIARFRRYVTVAPTGCWLWTGYTDTNNYGLFTYTDEPGKRRTITSHRFAWVHVAGLPIPEGKDHLDHACHSRSTCRGGKTCEHRRCVNPDHLEPVTGEENRRRALGNVVAATREKWQGRTHCGQGHELTGPNLIIRHGTQQVCRTCLQRAKRDYAARQRRQAGRPERPGARKAIA